MQSKKEISKSEYFISLWGKILAAGIVIVMLVTMAIMLKAVFDTNTDGEAGIGSFETIDYNNGWKLLTDEGEKLVDLPASTDAKKGEEIVITKKLPDDLSDGMSLLARARLQDIHIYINGELRGEYSSENLKGMPFYIPSAYIVCPINEEDSSGEVKIVLRVKSQGVTGRVYLSYGNNAWFGIIKDSLPKDMIAFGVLVLGFLLLFGTFFLEKALGARTTRALSLLMIDIGMWILSESTLRQFLFRRPSLCRFFAYFTVEIIGALACMYFDEVQHREYHKRYVFLESLVFIQLLINIILSLTGVAEFYQTIVFSHFWSGICIPVVVFNIISDIRKGKVKEYFITVIGMICFTTLSLCELVQFYINRMGGIGSFICIAMLILMAATILQAVFDEADYHSDREKKQTEMTINTIEIIASAIDARDEYTGGHSERVGLYACRLAREMASGYGLTEEDILRVQYIGLVHDIGKIGVADNVLNKSGRLTEEEFSLMKKHPEIGYEIMSSLGEGISGLLDGIRHHHERFDGKGYPDGLSGTDIPLIARILAIADSYDAMTSNRVYRKRLTDEQVTEEILRCAGTQFDPDLARIFVGLLDRGEISATTVNGAAVDESGQVRSSALLESKLQKDLLMKREISNPAHVRMLCYVIKLMEKKGRDYCVLFIGFDDREGNVTDHVWEDLNGVIGENTDAHDINIQYSQDVKIVALYDKDFSEIRKFMDACRNALPNVVINRLDNMNDFFLTEW